MVHKVSDIFNSQFLCDALLLSCPNIIIMVFRMLIFCPATLIRFRFSCSSSCLFLQQINIFSKLDVFDLVAMYINPVSLSFIGSNTLSRYEINIVGDIRSPCLVPTVVYNQSPSFPPTRTADCNLSLMFYRISVGLVPTPYDPDNFMFDEVQCIFKIDEAVENVSPFRLAFS